MSRWSEAYEQAMKAALEPYIERQPRRARELWSEFKEKVEDEGYEPGNFAHEVMWRSEELIAREAVAMLATEIDAGLALGRPPSESLNWATGRANSLIHEAVSIQSTGLGSNAVATAKGRGAQRFLRDVEYVPSYAATKANEAVEPELHAKREELHAERRRLEQREAGARVEHRRQNYRLRIENLTAVQYALEAEYEAAIAAAKEER